MFDTDSRPEGEARSDGAAGVPQPQSQPDPYSDSQQNPLTVPQPSENFGGQAEQVFSTNSAELPRASSQSSPAISGQSFVARPQEKGFPYRMPEAIFHIEVEKIKPNPHQPRRMFDEQGIRDLAASIREFGIIQPLIVTKVETEIPTGTQVEYFLIAGERRLRAAKLLGLPRIPAIIKNISFERERLELAIIENLQRENLNPLEMARAYARLQDEFRLTQREIASRLGKSREVVANTIRLLDLPQTIQQAIAEGRISESHGRLLLAVTEPVVQERLFYDLIDQHLTTRALRERVTALKRAKEPPKPSQQEALDPELQMIQEKLSSELRAPVKISQSGETGKITINFYSKEELESLLYRLANEEAI